MGWVEAGFLCLVKCPVEFEPETLQFVHNTLTQQAILPKCLCLFIKLDLINVAKIESPTRWL